MTVVPVCSVCGFEPNVRNPRLARRSLTRHSCRRQFDLAERAARAAARQLAAEVERAKRITHEHTGYALSYTRTEGWRIHFVDDPELDAPLADDDPPLAEILHPPFGASA